MSRFEERLRTGPPIVADGGMGALISAAVPRLRCPEEANLRAPESVVSVHVGYIRAGAELIETNTFGANRPKLGAQLPRGRVRADQLDGRPPRARGARGHRPRRLHRRLDRAARRRRAAAGDARGAVRRAGVDPRGPRRRRVHGRDVLRPRRARDCDRGRAQRLDPADRRADDLRRGRADARRRDRATGRRAARGARRRRDRRQPRRRPGGALAALAEMQRDGLVLAALPNVGLASLAGPRIVYPHATPEYFARVRRAGARARRRPDRRLLRDDARADRGDPRARSTRTGRPRGRSSSTSAR